MIDRSHDRPIVRQASALGISRSTVYALPTPISQRDQELMKRIDRLHLEMPYAGWRMLRDLLALDGVQVGRKHVATLMQRMSIGAAEEALAHYNPPAIMNTDQGSQFTSQALTGLLKSHRIRISMDRKGAWRDHVFVERLWRSVKYEEVYLHAYDSVSDSRTGLRRYFDLYNRRRPPFSLGRKTPDQVYFNQQPLTLAA